MRQMTVTHPRLHNVVLAHQLDKLKMEHLLQVAMEYLGEEHQHVEMYIISLFNIWNVCNSEASSRVSFGQLVVVKLFRMFLFLGRKGGGKATIAMKPHHRLYPVPGPFHSFSIKFHSSIWWTLFSSSHIQKSPWVTNGLCSITLFLSCLFETQNLFFL